MPLVREIMSPIRCALSSNNTLADVVRSMGEHGVSCVLVCDGDKPNGIVTERDVVRIYAAHLDDASVAERTVESFMTVDPTCVLDSLPVADALMLARSRGVRHLPVVNDQGVLVGVVTQTDAIKAYLESLEANNQLRKANQDLKLLSLEDPLVHTGNRRALDVEISHVDAESSRYDRPYAVAMIDVDFFKRYNDCYGHQKGDDALVKVANILKQEIRESDRLFRYGGEEFLILMPNTDQTEALPLAERIAIALESADIEHEESPFGRITACVGVATRRETAEDTIKQADKALYKAKNAGRNRIVLAD